MTGPVSSAIPFLAHLASCGMKPAPFLSDPVAHPCHPTNETSLPSVGHFLCASMVALLDLPAGASQFEGAGLVLRVSKGHLGVKIPLFRTGLGVSPLAVSVMDHRPGTTSQGVLVGCGGDLERLDVLVVRKPPPAGTLQARPQPAHCSIPADLLRR